MKTLISYSIIFCLSVWNLLSQDLGSFEITNQYVGSFISRWAAEPGVQILSGDYNGDGKTDIALLKQKPGWSTIPVAFSEGDGRFAISNRSVGIFVTNWASQSGVKAIAKDFNGDGKTDIALVRQTAGWTSIPVAFSNGDGSFQVSNSFVGTFIGEWSTRSGVEVVPNDFNGDGKTDIALVRKERGWSTIPIAFSNGDGSFWVTNRSVGSFISTWATRSGVQVLTGDFNGDLKADIALVRQDRGWGTIPVALYRSHGRFTITNEPISRFANEWAPTAGVKVFAKDVSGDGRSDFALVNQRPGWVSLPLAVAGQAGCFTPVKQAAGRFISHWAPTSGVQVVPGDYNNDQKIDFALVRQRQGWESIPIAFSEGDGAFTITNYRPGPFAERWTSTSGVVLVPGDYDGDGKTDIALVRQKQGWSTIPIAFSRS